MRKIYGFLGATALLALASCSNENVDAPNIGPETKGEAFIQVQLKLVGTGTRADNPSWGSYKYGTAAENAVQKLTLGFYDATGTLIQLAPATAANVSYPGEASQGTDGTNVAQTYQVYQVEVSAITKENATQMVAYVNCTAPTGNLDLTAQQSSLGDDENGYIMTNSVYYNGTNQLVNSTVIGQSNFYTDASSKPEGYQPVAIYVERLAAKVEFAGVKTVSDVEIYDKNGKKGKLTFTPKYWFIQNQANSEYLIKNLTSNSQPSWANASDDFRNFWSITPNYSSTSSPFGLDALSVEDITGTSSSTKTANLTSGSGDYAYVPTTNNSIEYIFENTFAASRLSNYSGYNPWSAITSIGILGEYEASGTDAEFNLNLGNAVKTFYLRGGYLAVDGEITKVNMAYSESDLIAQLLSEAKITAKKGETALEGNELVALFMVSLPSSGNIVKIEANTTAAGFSEVTFSINGTEVSSEVETALNTAIKTYTDLTPAYSYTSGLAYFVVPLRHHTATGDIDTYKALDQVAEGDYGIVRNHWYNLSVNSITGLATGVGDPEEDEPQNPEPTVTYYIDADLNVLQWHALPQQSVDL